MGRGGEGTATTLGAASSRRNQNSALYARFVNFGQALTDILQGIDLGDAAETFLRVWVVPSEPHGPEAAAEPSNAKPCANKGMRR